MNPSTDAIEDPAQPDSLRATIRDQFPALREPLRSEDEIVGSWQESGQPVVTVLCATFNHVGLVTDALKGFLMQRTTFSFEIVVRDDASTDGTQEIIESFARRYPRIIRPVLHCNNRLARGVRPVHDYPELISGEFTALCQGDDFWTDPGKLQRQVEHLRRNPSVVLSACATLCVRTSDATTWTTGNTPAEVIYSRLPNRYHHTSTYVLRSAPYQEVIKKHLIPTGLYGDTPLRHLIVLHGRIAALPGTASVYWIDGDGVWSSLDAREQAARHVWMYGKLARVMPIRRRWQVLGELLRSSLQIVALGSEPTADSIPMRLASRASRFVERWRNRFSALGIAFRSLRQGGRGWGH